MFLQYLFFQHLNINSNKNEFIENLRYSHALYCKCIVYNTLCYPDILYNVVFAD